MEPTHGHYGSRSTADTGMSDVRRGPGSPQDDDVPAVAARPVPTRVQISAVQVLASSLAAVSAAVVCSFAGVAGTIVGTAVASACATVASALYAHSLQRTRERLRNVPTWHRAATTALQRPPEPPEEQPSLAERLRALPWRWVALATVGVFVLSAAAITLIEAGAGSSLASMIGGTSGQSGGTFAPINGSSHQANQPTPASSPTTSGTASTSPASPTATPTSSPGGTENSSPTSTGPPASPSGGLLSSLVQPTDSGNG